MPVIELDVLLAYLVAENRHHKIASRYFSGVVAGSLPKPAVSPFAIQELELGVKAKKILPYGRTAQLNGELARFLTDVCEALKVHEIRMVPLRCEFFSKSAEFRDAYRLTYFDSLHAASSFFHDKEIVSTDADYDVVNQIKRIDPYGL